MPRVATKRIPKAKAAKPAAPSPAEFSENAPSEAPVEVAVEVEVPKQPESRSAPTQAGVVEMYKRETEAHSEPPAPVLDRRGAAPSMNIAKLQAMPMPELNKMAREMGVENYGTMRKHEVIFHVLQ